jgi:hypothetical protein
MTANKTNLPPHAVRTLQAMAINKSAVSSQRGVVEADRVTLSSAAPSRVDGKQEYLRAFQGRF